MISFVNKGDFSKTEKFLKKSLGRDYKSVLEKYARLGVESLAAATPIDSGKTASSWGYEIIQNGSSLSVVWTNTNINKGVNIAIILDSGHGVKGGGWVRGRNFIDPSIRPIFDKMADAAWKEVTGS